MASEKIMIIDDTLDLLSELNELLDCSGYCPTVVSDPKIAVRSEYQTGMDEKTFSILPNLEITQSTDTVSLEDINTSDNVIIQHETDGSGNLIVVAMTGIED
jgi:hypothetical protein